MRKFHDAMRVVVGTVSKFALSGFPVKTWKLLEWKCVLLRALHGCDIPNAKNMSASCHGVVLK